ncbi:unnamed protein product [Fusarium equiseti]|uniref:Uncharacterized protein n=1 Tax=Fusarium equiseti TaxID=61235 RepID=A0A8J2IDZ4_FUSEQ|nr:unnamed protein product [Fusarium equiseti]
MHFSFLLAALAIGASAVPRGVNVDLPNKVNVDKSKVPLLGEVVDLDLDVDVEGSILLDRGVKRAVTIGGER